MIREAEADIWLIGSSGEEEDCGKIREHRGSLHRHDQERDPRSSAAAT